MSSRKDLAFLPRPVARALKSLGRELFRNGSTGLNGLDLRLIEATDGKRDGYFIQLGANDGIRQSNTYKLQRRHGWTGLLVKPIPRRFEECIRNRAFARRPHVKCAACVPFDYQAPTVELEYSDLM